MALPKVRPDGVSPVMWDIASYVRAACAQAYINGKMNIETFAGMEQGQRDSLMNEALRSTENIAVQAVVDLHNRMRCENIVNAIFRKPLQ